MHMHMARACAWQAWLHTYKKELRIRSATIALNASRSGVDGIGGDITREVGASAKAGEQGTEAGADAGDVTSGMATFAAG